MNRNLTLCIIAMFCLLTAFMEPGAYAESVKNVFVSIAPQKYFVDAIGGEFVETTVIVSPDRSPADYEPSPAQMMKMAKADIYFSIGVPFENVWLKKFLAINPQMKVIATDEGIEKKPIDRYEIVETESGHPEDEHHRHRGAMDPHIWLSPPLVKIQARHIADGLIAADPAHAEMFKQNLSRFIARIDHLNRELTALFTPETQGKKFLVFHPSWGYFADAYGLEQISIEIEGKAPKAREVKQLIEYARAHRIRLILVQPQFSAKQAKIIAGEINGKIIPADPLAESWYDNIRTVALSIKQALQ